MRLGCTAFGNPPFSDGSPFRALGIQETPQSSGIDSLRTESSSHFLRLEAAGALSGAAAGGLFGLCALLIQTSMTQVDIAKYGDAAVDHGAAFLQPGTILAMGALGGFLGLVYPVAVISTPWLGRWGGTGFAVVMTIVIQPLLAAGRYYFSAVVELIQSGTTPSGVFKTGGVVVDLASPLLVIPLMSALLLLLGLAIHRLVQSVSGWLLPMPAGLYAVVAIVIGLPGSAFFVLLVLVATGMIGGE